MCSRAIAMRHLHGVAQFGGVVVQVGRLVLHIALDALQCLGYPLHRGGGHGLT